jgi:biopolymer transport protein ExbD
MRYRRYPAWPAAESGQPIMALNTTPLIDVMLVLLIMFIVTIPMMTHAVKIDLPTGPARLIPKVPQTHDVAVDAAGRVSWDGVVIAEAALPARLAAFRAHDPEGHLLFRADAEARYEQVDRLLAMVKRARIESMGFVGNEAYARELDR